MAQESGHVVMQTPAPYMGDPFLSASAGKIWTIDFKKLSHKEVFYFLSKADHYLWKGLMCQETDDVIYTTM